MPQSSGITDNISGVKPPAVDGDFIDDTREVTVREWSDLVHGVMAMRDCSKPDAERYIATTGAEDVERELQPRGQQSTRWGGA